MERSGKTYLVFNRREGDAPKRRDREVAVPEQLLDWFAAHDDEHLIPAKHKTERRDIIYKAHSKCLGSIMTGRAKAKNELRNSAD